MKLKAAVTGAFRKSSWTTSTALHSRPRSTAMSWLSIFPFPGLGDPQSSMSRKPTSPWIGGTGWAVRSGCQAFQSSRSARRITSKVPWSRLPACTSGPSDDSCPGTKKSSSSSQSCWTRRPGSRAGSRPCSRWTRSGSRGRRKPRFFGYSSTAVDDESPRFASQ